jgi:hypothetical protein
MCPALLHQNQHTSPILKINIQSPHPLTPFRQSWHQIPCTNPSGIRRISTNHFIPALRPIDTLNNQDKVLDITDAIAETEFIVIVETFVRREAGLDVTCCAPDLG